MTGLQTAQVLAAEDAAPAGDTQLILAAVVGIALLVLLVTVAKLHPLLRA